MGRPPPAGCRNSLNCRRWPRRRRTLLEIHRPSQLLVVQSKDCPLGGAAAPAAAGSAAGGGVNTAVREHDPLPLPRALFDDTKGLLLLSGCASPDTRAELENGVLHGSAYLAFGAAGALLRWVACGAASRRSGQCCCMGPSAEHSLHYLHGVPL